MYPATNYAANMFQRAQELDYWRRVAAVAEQRHARLAVLERALTQAFSTSPDLFFGLDASGLAAQVVTLVEQKR